MAMKVAVKMKGLMETTLKIGISKGDQEEKGPLLLNVAVEEAEVGPMKWPCAGLASLIVLIITIIISLSGDPTATMIPLILVLHKSGIPASTLRSRGTLQLLGKW
jgi:hypothetical protein